MRTLDLVFLLIALAGGTLWVEQGHRVVIDAPTAAELQMLVAAAACPANDTMPYDATCLTFLKGATETGMNWRVMEQPAAARVPQ